MRASGANPAHCFDVPATTPATKLPCPRPVVELVFVGPIRAFDDVPKVRMIFGDTGVEHGHLHPSPGVPLLPQRRRAHALRDALAADEQRTPTLSPPPRRLRLVRPAPPAASTFVPCAHPSPRLEAPREASRAPRRPSPLPVVVARAVVDALDDDEIRRKPRRRDVVARRHSKRRFARRRVAPSRAFSRAHVRPRARRSLVRTASLVRRRRRVRLEPRDERPARRPVRAHALARPSRRSASASRTRAFESASRASSSSVAASTPPALTRPRRVAVARVVLGATRADSSDARRRRRALTTAATTTTTTTATTRDALARARALARDSPCARVGRVSARRHRATASASRARRRAFEPRSV